MEPILFSIVTPSFNQGAFLAETMESVLCQEGDFSVDYIVADGASSDDSVDIIRKYERLLLDGNWPVRCRGIRFRWLSERDAGQTDALKKGFGMAQGGILAWLNSDDFYLPGTLQRVADFFRGSPEAGLVYGGGEYCDATGTVIGRYRTENFDFEKLAWFNFICQPAAFFRRAAFESAGGLDERLHFAMDYDLWIRIGQRFPCRYLPEPLARYRLHEDSKTISDRTLLDNSEEGLRVAMKYYRWAPMTRIYNCCSFRCKTAIPRFLAERRPAVALSALLCSIFVSLRLNGGIDRRDLKLLRMENFRKLFKSRIEIMTGAGEK